MQHPLNERGDAVVDTLVEHRLPRLGAQAAALFIVCPLAVYLPASIFPDE